MPVVSDLTYPLGGKVTVLETEGYTVTVSTAKEGLFKGLSTIVIDGVNLSSGSPCAKVLYNKSIRKADRRLFHDMIVVGLEGAALEGHDLANALRIVLSGMKKQGVIKGAVITCGDMTVI